MSVLRLHCFYNKPLEDITEEDLRQYWLCCQSNLCWSAALSLIYKGIIPRSLLRLIIPDLIRDPVKHVSGFRLEFIRRFLWRIYPELDSGPE